MAGKSNIEWTEQTWNSLAGCAVLSPGCTNCYAMKMAARLEAMGQPLYRGLTKSSKAGAVWRGTVRSAPDVLLAPLRRKKPTMYFVNSMSDLFYELFADELIDQIFAVMALTPHHTYQVLTKRAKRMREYLRDPNVRRRIYERACEMVVEVDLPVILIADRVTEPNAPAGPRIYLDLWPLPNVWLGVSTERQQEADERIPELLQTPAAIRFISAEPLLGPLRLDQLHRDGINQTYVDDALTGFNSNGCGGWTGAKLDWVIVGGESGAGARPMHPYWVQSLRDQCDLAKVPFFFKQWGAWAPISEMSEDLVDSLYYPSPKRDPEAARRCKVASHVLHVDGSRHDRIEVNAFMADKRPMMMFEVGKGRAGHALGGVEYRAMPKAVE